MKVRKLILLFLFTVLFTPFTSSAIEESPKVYIVIVNKLTLEDVQTMDRLKGIVEEGSIGLMNTRGTLGYTGAESFLTINSSRRTTGNLIIFDIEIDGERIINKSIGRLINLNVTNNYSPKLGAIGDNLHKQGLKTAIYGNSDLLLNEYRMSVLIPMDSRGLVDYGNINNITLEDDKYPFKTRTDFEKLLLESVNSPGDLIVIDTGDLDRVFRYKENLTKGEYSNLRQNILKDIDNFIYNLTNLIQKEKSIVIITSPNSGESINDNSKLTPLILWGSSINKGVLYSPTTQREIIASNIDIGPTIMTYLNQTMEDMSGNSLNSIEKTINLEDILKINKSINNTSKVRYNTLYYYGILSIITFSIGIIIFLLNIRLESKIEVILKLSIRTLMIVPIVLILVSLFRPSNIKEYLFILMFILLILIAILWKFKFINNQSLFIGLSIVILIIIDLVFDNYISRYSVLSYDPIIGARYYGIGNEMVGLFLGAVTIVSTNLIGKSSKNIVPLFLFVICGIITGHPSIGANIGGSLAFLFSIIMFVIENYREELNYRKIIYLILLLLISVFSIGFMDVVLNKNMTHLGKNLIAIKNHGIDVALEIIWRKLLMNIKLIGTSFWTYLLFLHIVIHILVLHYRRIDKITVIGYMAGLSGILGGFLLNDSGLILASIGMNLITFELFLDNIRNKVK